MLTIVVPGDEHYDDANGKFTTIGDVVLELEHSLVSLSKWEQKFEKPFLGREEKSNEETAAYIKAMVLTPDVSDKVFDRMTEDNLADINTYLGTKMTATWFHDPPGAPRTDEVITADLIYYWLITFQIPFECQHWHLNRLFTLIRVCNLKAAKPKKMSRTEIAARNRAINAQRRKQLGTKG